MVNVEDMSEESLKRFVQRKFGDETPEGELVVSTQELGTFDTLGKRDVCLGKTSLWAYAQSKKSGFDNEEGALLYLYDCDGKWYDKNGDEVQGYLTFKPRGD